MNSKTLNEMTLRKLERTLTRQKDAMAETQHHIDLVRAAIEKEEAEEQKTEPRLPLKEPKK